MRFLLKWRGSRMDRSAYGPLRIRVSAALIRPLRIEMVSFTNLSPFNGRRSDLCATPQSQDWLKIFLEPVRINERPLISRGPEVTVYIKQYKSIQIFFDTKFATQLVFSLAPLPSSTGPQAAAQTGTNPADIPSIVVLPYILISTKLFYQQMHLVLKHKMLQFIFKIYFKYKL